MRRGGILHPELAAGIARLGHGHVVAVTDCGMPIPPGVETVTLALSAGVPRLTQVLDAVLAEIVVEGSLAAREAGPDVRDWLTGRGLGPELVDHEDLKTMLPGCRLIVRTGEATSYANVLLRCGVPF